MSGPPNIQRFPTSLATAYAPGAMPAALYSATVALTDSEPPVKTGANLTDADATIQPVTDKASQYTLPDATLTANRTLTLGTTSAWAGLQVRIVRKDVTANTYAVGTLFTFPASTAMAAWFQYTGNYWIFISAGYIQ